MPVTDHNVSVIRASTAVGLLLVSSTAIFGVLGTRAARPQLPPIEPVWVNGIMGVYNPETGMFVPSGSPLFDETCDLIQRRREQAAGYGNGGWPYEHHWYFFPGIHAFGSYPSAPIGGASGARYGSGAGGSSEGFFSSHFGSTRGGIGGFGHGMGGSHS